jgi:serine/threonine protein kinase/WD40 repeat protein
MESAKPSVDEIYLSALERSSAQARSAYLDQACADDDKLRQRVERLLRAQPNVGSFLESPAPEFAETIVPARCERTGTIIGPYKLLEEIGEGGFGVVYMADQNAPVRRRVALKIIKPGMDSKEVLARFKAELQALALMDHPNIARVLDAGATDAGRPYFVMELVRGVPITQYCDQNNLDVRERLDLFVQVCHAVQHAHQKGIIHRDLKPSNVLVTMHDALPMPKVIDFGVAKAIDRQLTQETLFTRFAEMIGTPLYMSPEQAEMNSLDIDTRSDIYSLGVLLYELLTGSTPFDPNRLQQAGFDEIRRIIREEEPPKPSTRIGTLTRTRKVAAAHRHADPNHLSQLVRGELDWIVMKSLEKDRTRRYETANSLALDVLRYLADEPVLACPPSRRYRLRKFVRRHRRSVLAASAVLLALVAGVIGTTWGMIRATRAEVQAVRAADQTQIALTEKQLALTQKVAALATAQKSERTRSEELWQALVAQARAHRLSRRPGQRFESLATLKEATRLAHTLNLPQGNFQELRNAAIATLAVPDLYLTGPWNAWPADALALDFDEAQAVIARTDRTGNCSIRRVADDTEICRIPGLGLPAWPLLSRDAKFVALCELTHGLNPGKGVQIWQLEGTTPRQLLNDANAFTVVFRGSQQFALSYNDGSIGLFELPSGRQLNRLAPDALNHALNIALHPTEPLVAVCSYVGTVLQLRDTRTGKVVAFSPDQEGLTSLAWHPSGRTLAVADRTGQIRLYDRTTLQVYRTLECDDAVTSINFDDAGRRLAVRGWSGRVRLFDVITSERLMVTAGPIAACRFSPDGLRLAGGIQEGRVGIWRVAGGQEYRTLVRSHAPPKMQAYRYAAVDPDSRFLVCATDDGFGLWDLATGGDLAFVPTGRNNSVLFEPSGALLTLSNSSLGLRRWPITKEFESTRKLSIGPAEPLRLSIGGFIGQSRDGRVTVTNCRSVSDGVTNAGAWILHAGAKEPIRLDAGADIGDIAISRDGRWVVTTTFGVGLAKLWDARDGRLVKRLANWGANGPCFSPDGRWLSTTLEGGRLFAVKDWELGPCLGPRPAFSPDSRLAAVATVAGLRLLEVDTRREIAVLEAPELDPIDQVLFTPDGAKLITVSYAKGLHVWDLRVIRVQLKVLGLDWDWPEFPPAAPAPPLVEPVKVEILPAQDAASDSSAARLAKPHAKPGA